MKPADVTNKYKGLIDIRGLMIGFGARLRKPSVVHKKPGINLGADGEHVDSQRLRQRRVAPRKDAVRCKPPEAPRVPVLVQKFYINSCPRYHKKKKRKGGRALGQLGRGCTPVHSDVAPPPRLGVGVLRHVDCGVRV